MPITYLGHSAFEIDTISNKILIDPFLVEAPNYNTKEISDIFVTHAHGDHLGSAIDISKETGARITAIYELANYCRLKGANVNPIGLGNWQNFKWGRVIAVPAFHSGSTDDGVYGGCPCGYVFEIGNKMIYHAGDTCLSSEMKTIGEIYEPDLAMLPIGGQFTMDIEHSIIAAEWLGVSAVIPMHYNTFDAISVDIKEFENGIRKLGKLPIILKTGQTFDSFSK